MLLKASMMCVFAAMHHCCRQPLREADHGSEDDVSTISSAAASPALLLEPSAETAAQPQRGLLSRQGSMSNLQEDLAAQPPEGRRPLTFCQKAGAGITATLLLGTLAAIGLVVMAFPSPYLDGAPSCRSGAAIAVAPETSNASQALVVWSGRSQAGSMYHEWLHVLRWAGVVWQSGHGHRAVRSHCWLQANQKSTAANSALQPA
jgi:hypothetical protein